MTAIVGAELQIDRLISADPGNGVVAALDSSGAAVNLIAYGPGTGDVTYSAPTGNTTNTRTHRFDRPIVSTSTITAGGTATAPELILDQGAADTDIASLRSSDVAHGMTTLATTDTFGRVAKYSATAGGLRLAGLSEATISLMLTGYGTTEDATRSTAAVAPVYFMSSTKTGTTAGAMGANKNMVAFSNDATVHFILDSDGDSHQDVGTAWTNFDSHDDVALLNLMSAHVTRQDDPLKDSFRGWLEQSRDELEKIRLVTFNEDGHHFVNMSRLQMLTVGAIRQLAARLTAVEQLLLPAH